MIEKLKTTDFEQLNEDQVTEIVNEMIKLPEDGLIEGIYAIIDNMKDDYEVIPAQYNMVFDHEVIKVVIDKLLTINKQ